MPRGNLTGLEARHREALIAVDSYDITLDVTGGPERFRSTSSVQFSAKEAGSTTFIDAISTEVHRVILNGTELDPKAASDGTRIELPDLQNENLLIVEFDGVYSNTGEGLHRFVDPADGETYLYTQFQVPDSRRVFAVFEQPDLKAVFKFTVIAPLSWEVVSNMPVLAKHPTADCNATLWNFEATPRVSSYITALVAGPFASHRDSLVSSDGREIPLGLFVRKSLGAHLDSDYLFEITKRGFAYFESKFGVAYPFTKYDQLFVPEFNAGAMENAGCVTIAEQYVFRSKVADAVRERRVVTVLHELAHMWFGDLVTMKWWDGLWLNESFAEWASTLATAEVTEWQDAWTTFAAGGKTWAYRQDQLPTTHPVAAEIWDIDDVLVNFDGITYEKGASVLKQLVAWVGLESFLAGVSRYFKRHAWKNTTVQDLLVELENASGRDLSQWFQAWIEAPGVNTLSPRIETDAAGVITRFVVDQAAGSAQTPLRDHRLAIGFYRLRNDSYVREQQVEIDVTGAETVVAELEGVTRPELILLNDDDLSYAKIRLDENSLAVATQGLSSVSDPLARALIWGSLWEYVRDAEITAREFIEVALWHLGAETASTTVRVVLENLRLAAEAYVAPEHRMRTRTEVADRLWGLTQSAAAGSDAQFQFVTAFAGVAEASSHLNEVAELLDGTLTLNGLEIDTDLRWKLSTAQAAAGQLTEHQIDELLAADQTASGEKAAACAKAALPSDADKQRAWAEMFNNPAITNDVARGMVVGFVRMTDPAQLDPYIGRYFASIDQIWQERSYAIAEILVESLYPGHLGGERTVRQSREWLDSNPDAAAPLRRFVLEGLAETERALAASRRDSEQ